VHTKETLLEYKIGAAQQGQAGVTVYTNTISAATSEYAIIFRAPRTETIDTVGVFLGTHAATPSFTIGIQGVDVNGDPDNVDISTNAVTFAPTSEGFKWQVLAAGVSLTQDTDYAIVVNAFTGTGSIGLSSYDLHTLTELPYVNESTDTGVTWTQKADQVPIYGLRNSGDTGDAYGNPSSSPFNLDTTVTTSGHRIAKKVIIPASFGSRVQLHGLHLLGYFTGDYKLGIWHNDNTEIVLSGTLNHDHSGTPGTKINAMCYFPPVWLDTGVAYYIGAEATGAAIALNQWVVNADVDLSPFPGYPDNNIFTYAPSTWTKVTGKTLSMGSLLISSWDKHGVEMDHLTEGMSR